ncbi:hypothetical protein CsSME_00027847 [Camellia sinensis var. sinensis]
MLKYKYLQPAPIFICKCCFFSLVSVIFCIAMSIPGVLEANFVEPAHDKQSFERTTALAKLEARLVVMDISVAAMDYELRTMRGDEEIRVLMEKIRTL